MERSILENHIPSLLPSGKKWQLVWHDEFDGDTLDRSNECFGYRDGDQPSPLLRDAVLPHAFVVDYVRVFDEVQ